MLGSPITTDTLELINLRNQLEQENAMRLSMNQLMNLQMTSFEAASNSGIKDASQLGKNNMSVFDLANESQGGGVNIGGTITGNHGSSSKVIVDGVDMSDPSKIVKKTGSGALYFKNVLATLFITVGVMVQMQ